MEEAENEMNRIADMAIATLNADERAKIAEEQSNTAAGTALGSLVGTLAVHLSALNLGDNKHV